ncbi:MAG: pirin family protein [Polyangia bacterium]|jgi:redox-sensitive bicupin YhaK (pirin superfamily)|nr:pirin family protein [Polyangia bacterium]
MCFSFDSQDPTDPLANGFGVIEALDEIRIPPGAGGASLPRRDADVLTYVLEGSLAQEDTSGRSGVIHSGEFQRMNTGQRIRHCERNGSHADWAHVFQIWLRAKTSPGHHPVELIRFSTAVRRGLLCLIASPNGDAGSLSIRQDALIYSSILDPGQHMVHELAPGRSAWVHVVRGEISIDDLVLARGDGIGVSDEISVSFTATDYGETEILLIDLPKAPLPPAAEALHD